MLVRKSSSLIQRPTLPDAALASASLPRRTPSATISFCRAVARFDAAAGEKRVDARRQFSGGDALQLRLRRGFRQRAGLHGGLSINRNEKECGYTADTKNGRQLLLGFCVYFVDQELSFILFGELFQDRSNHFTGATPLSKEVNQYWFVCIYKITKARHRFLVRTTDCIPEIALNGQ